ncbi:MAG TPA: 1,4-alpha-glucan branching protein GlgB [Niabella sp.]|nr:1,4-alpha-glucan branching protein GlgB [Niabella sp.]HOZ95768.1 1,4-alpha-glucan branching protein GlgB [Niabella sp.]HQW13622.1 1,4-alpha-glucan branching protein GlgB [Niabella sp.]HQX19016.1 1,4-alpha-glucan branching protein GlgB [Niabella sp.]HQX40848.1 1,4-alpha-glucan branching protein GlgB [Niabella sp.]
MPIDIKPIQEKFEKENYIDTSEPVWNYSLLTDEDIKNFQDGTNYSLYEKFGSHTIQVNGIWGMYFCVWAPSAKFLFVTGNFNDWNKVSHPLTARWDSSGIWEGFIPNFNLGEVYKYHIVGANNRIGDKGDPFANFWELKPLTASITWDLFYEWEDAEWMQNRKKHNALDAPWSVYEVHLASWQKPEPGNEHKYNTYDQIRERLVPYVKEMGFTHVELMPVAEHPFDGSWGYQITGYYAPTSRFGDPQGFMRLVDAFHQAGIGVILDWVPSHFPYDSHGLYMFDGAHTYEYADMRKGFHPDWNSYIFNYKRGEVKSFLISNARFWFDLFHIDGIRVDAVSSMLKLNYSRKEGEWEPNEHGGDGNLEAIQFIKHLNEMIFRDFPDVQTIAEEATDWPGVSRPTFADGLGFGMKWMMGWMHDSLDYFKREPVHRSYHQNDFTFSMMYYNDENFMLPISHDEVVHGKSPLIFKMPGDLWQKFANLRLFFTYMWTHPGGKLLFMGSEFGQTTEWNYQSELDWGLLQHASHRGAQSCLKALNTVLRDEPAMYINQFNQHSFEWFDLNHRDEGVIMYKRKGKEPEDDVLVILNMTPTVYHDWGIEVYNKPYTQEIFNSDLKEFDGTGDVFNKEIRSECLDIAEKKYRITINIPPLAGIILK